MCRANSTIAYSLSIVLAGSMLLGSRGAAAQTPSPSSPSLQDTLSWLKEFLPRATGGRVTEAGPGDVSDLITENLEIISGCHVAFHGDRTSYQNGKAMSSDDFTDTLSLADINPSTISVSASQLGPNGIAVFMYTTGNIRLIADVNNHVSDGTTEHQAMHIYYESVGLFVDKASAQRVANAFKHAAELCASTQPF